MTQMIYTVQPGDTLYSIARLYGSTIQAIVDANNILTEIQDFLELYENVIEDKIITKFEKIALLNQAKLALIEANTVEKLISKYEYSE